MTYRAKSLEDEINELKDRVKVLEDAMASEANDSSDWQQTFAPSEEEPVETPPEIVFEIMMGKTNHVTSPFSYGLHTCPFCNKSYGTWYSGPTTNVGRKLNITDDGLWNEMRKHDIVALFERSCKHCQTTWYVHQKRLK